MEIGQKIKSIRFFLGLTQKQMADKLKLKQSQVSKIESSDQEIPIDALKRVIKVFDIDPNWFLFDEGRRPDFFDKMPNNRKNLDQNGQGSVV